MSSTDPNLSQYIGTLKWYIIGFFSIFLVLIAVLAIHLIYNYLIADTNVNSIKGFTLLPDLNLFDRQLNYTFTNSEILINENGINPQDKMSLFLMGIIILVGILLIFTIRKYIQLIDIEQLQKSFFYQIKTMKEEFTQEITKITTAAEEFQRLQEQNQSMDSIIQKYITESEDKMERQMNPKFLSINTLVTNINTSITELKDKLDSIIKK